MSNTRRLRLRVHADDDYRSQNLNWRTHVDKLAARASEQLSSYNVAFAVSEARDWPRRSARDLEDDLAALRTHDSGEGVDLVVGLVTALPTFTSSVHHLGMADVLGKHLVLRGTDDAVEFDALTTSGLMLSREEKTELYYERKRHRQASVFIHEVGHTVGAMHSDAPDELMRPVYNVKAAEFSVGNAVIMQLRLAHREVESDASRRAWHESLVAELRRRSKPSDDERRMMEWLTASLAAMPTATEASAPETPETPAQVSTEPSEKAKPAVPAKGASNEAVTLVEESNVQCPMLGMQRVDVKTSDEAALAEVRRLAAQMGGDTASTMRKLRGGKAYILATVFKCK
jgi:hypothetical protein